MGLLLKSLSRVDSLRLATAPAPIDEAPRAPIREASRSNVVPEPTAVPLEFAASMANVTARHAVPAAPLETGTSTANVTARHAIPAAPRGIDTSTICLAIPADEPSAPFSDEPISLEALFAVPFPSADLATAPMAPTVALAAPSKPSVSPQTAPSDFATALNRLEQLQQTLAQDFEDSQGARHSPSSDAPRAAALPPPNLRPELRELCDHLLSRCPLTKHCTFLVVDAGRAPLDHTWLLPLAAGLLDSTSDHQARALLVEVNPCSSAIAQMLGIDATSHSVDGTSDTAAFSNTYHPQIDIVRLSDSSLAAVTTPLEETWTELQESYNLILVASGPLGSDTSDRGGNPPNQIARSLLPLADAVILSVELGSTPVSVASKTAERLKAAGANLVGCVVQAAPATE